MPITIEGIGGAVTSGLVVRSKLGKRVANRSVVKPSGAIPIATEISSSLLSFSMVNVRVSVSQTSFVTLYLTVPPESLRSNVAEPKNVTSKGSSEGVKET